MISALLLSACAGPAEDVATASVADTAWVTTIVREPARFGATVDGPARDRWTALHRNDLRAAASFDGPGADSAPAVRARAELATVNAVLGDAAAVAWARLADRMAGRPTPPGLPATTFADMAVVASAAAFTPVPSAAGAPQATGASAPHAGLPAGLDLPAADLSARIAALEEAASRPVAHEGVVTIWSPLVYPALATAWAEATAPSPARSMEAELFSGHVAPDVVVALGETDTEEPCRDAVRRLDAQLDPWAASLAGSATPEGRALLHDLRLVEGARARRLTDEAVRALRAGAPACAGVLAAAAMDLATPREVGPVNSPTMYAALADAHLRNGRTREALDALEPLRAAIPEAAGLDETVEALAVLEGMTRSGDSREN